MLDFITTTTEKYFNLSPGETNTRTRRRRIVLPRQIIHTLAARLVPDLTEKTIGQSVGKVDHSTVIHSIKTINNLCDSDKRIRADVEAIEAKIKIEKIKRSKAKITPFTPSLCNPHIYTTREDLDKINPKTVQIHSFFGWENTPYILLISAKPKDQTKIDLIYKVVCNILNFQHIERWGNFEAKKYEFTRLMNRLKHDNAKHTTAEIRFEITTTAHLELFE